MVEAWLGNHVCRNWPLDILYCRWLRRSFCNVSEFWILSQFLGLGVLSATWRSFFLRIKFFFKYNNCVFKRIYLGKILVRPEMECMRMGGVFQHSRVRSGRGRIFGGLGRFLGLGRLKDCLPLLMCFSALCIPLKPKRKIKHLLVKDSGWFLEEKKNLWLLEISSKLARKFNLWSFIKGRYKF